MVKELGAMNMMKQYSSLILLIGLMFSSPKVVHAYVTLADSGQGIISFNKKLENSNDIDNNQYWGALYGVRQFFDKSDKWDLIYITNFAIDNTTIVERIIFRHQYEDVYLVADAYRGDRKPKQATHHVFRALSGEKADSITIDGKKLGLHGNADLIVYVGHHFFNADKYHKYHNVDNISRDVILLACMTDKMCDTINDVEANPVLLTTQLMAPEAYVLENVLESWIADEVSDNIRLKAAEAYSKYQKCSLRAALGVFKTQCD